ncbi:MAG: hypothetical protein HY551_02260 [Elusimicrobia bacterium]|nr:hypothetical protein [Elusimicrobiota bacterium]
MPEAPLRRWGPWVVLAFLAVIQFLALPGDYLGQEIDDSYYFLTAQSLARGEYRLGVSPGNPPLTFITPGLPLLLTPIAWLCGDSPIGFHVGAWIFLVVCDVLAFLWLDRKMKRWEALLCTAAFALSPMTLARAGKVMTEFPALGLTLTLFLLMDRPRWPSWGSGLVLAAVWLVRQGTVALAPAIALRHLVPGANMRPGPRERYYFLPADRGRWRDAFWSLLPTAAAMALYALWLSGAGARMSEIEEMRTSYAAGWTDVPRIVSSNCAYYAQLWGRLWLPLPGAPAWLETLFGFLLWGVCALGVWRVLRKDGSEPGAWWLLGLVGLHALWPWRYERYLASALPVVIWTFWEGICSLTRVAERGGPAGADRAKHAGGVFFVCLFAAQFLSQGRTVLASSAERGVPELRETYAWIRENTQAHAAFASLAYARDALYARRPFAPLPSVKFPQDMRRIFLKWRISYVLVHRTPDMGSSIEERFEPALRYAAMGRWLRGDPSVRPVYKNEREGSVVYFVSPGKSD